MFTEKDIENVISNFVSNKVHGHLMSIHMLKNMWWVYDSTIEKGCFPVGWCKFELHHLTGKQPFSIVVS